MFTWICPKCGREVPPSMQECPNCAPVAAVPPQPLPVVPPPVEGSPIPQGYMPQSAYQVPAPVYQQPAPVYQQPSAPPQQPAAYAYQQPAAEGLPSWLVTALVFVGLLAVGALFYFYLLPASKKESNSKPVAAVAEDGKPAKANPLSKQLEVTGIRITEDAKQKLLIRLLVINHSAADMGELKITVTLTADSGKGAPSIIGTFPVVVSDLGPFEAKEAKSTMITNLRAYELPDWQFLRAKAEITTE